MNLFQKPLISKDEIIHTRLSVYIGYSSLVLERKESHPVHSFESQMDRNSIFCEKNI